MVATVCTIVIGEQYSALAQITVPLMSSALGAPVEVVTDGDPWVQKLSLLERYDTDVLFVDVDLALRSFDWSDWDTGCFCATKFVVVPQCFLTHHRVDLPWFTTGIWYAPVSMRPVFARAREILTACRFGDMPSWLHEEASLNVALQESGHATQVQNDSYNTMVISDAPVSEFARGVHFIGHHKSKLERVTRFLKENKHVC